MQTAVVAKVDGRVLEIAGQQSTVVVPQAAPLMLAHAGAVDQNEQLSAGLRKRRLERLPRELERVASVAELHLDRERVATLAQVVPDHSVDCCQHCRALEPGDALAEERREL